MPYDTVKLEHDFERPRSGGKTDFIKRPVARSYEEALSTRMDWYHPGGDIRNDKGQIIGTRKAGWFIKGYKWQDDPDHVFSNVVIEEE